MKTVGELLQAKGHAIWSIAPDATVYEALELMAEKDVGALMIIDAGKLVGIMSERDYARKVILKGRFSKETPVRAIMTEKVMYAWADDTIAECMALMAEMRLRHLPVFEGDRLIGVISIGDVGKAIIAEQKLEI
jgi:CBS domain-containing protein